MNMRRFTPLTNAFSKKWENYMHAVGFYFMVYNFVKVAGTVKTSPAIAAGVMGHQWRMEGVVTMTDTMRAKGALALRHPYGCEQSFRRLIRSLTPTQPSPLVGHVLP